MPRLLLVVVLLASTAPSAFAQPDEGSVWLRYESLNPLIDDDFNPYEVTNRKLVSSAHVVGAQFKVGSETHVTLEVPMAYANARISQFEVRDNGYGSTSYTTEDFSWGNPLFGIEHRVSSTLSLDGGVRVPVARRLSASEAPRTGGNRPADRFDLTGLWVGLAANLEHAEAFLPDAAALHVGAKVRQALGRSTVHARLQPTIAVPVGQLGSGDEREGPAVTLGYGLEVARTLGSSTLQGGVIGRFKLREGSVYETTFVHALSLRAELGEGPIRPRLTVQKPIGPEYYYRDTGLVVGVGLAARFR